MRLPRLGAQFPVGEQVRVFKGWRCEDLFRFKSFESAQSQAAYLRSKGYVLPGYLIRRTRQAEWHVVRFYVAKWEIL